MPLLDLFIHPLDLVCYLFGKPEIIACQRIAKDSYILMLQHPHIIGTLELSTAYTWTTAEESLKVCTSKAIYRLSQMEELTFEPKPPLCSLAFLLRRSVPAAKTDRIPIRPQQLHPTLP